MRLSPGSRFHAAKTTCDQGNCVFVQFDPRANPDLRRLSFNYQDVALDTEGHMHQSLRCLNNTHKQVGLKGDP